MTCRGYDPKAVKVHKSIRRFDAKSTDAHVKGARIRSYVEILKTNLRSAKGAGK